MSKMTLILVAAVFVLMGAVTAVQAQSKTKTKGKDRTTCINLVDASPGFRAKGLTKKGGGSRELRYEAAIERCMRGERI